MQILEMGLEIKKKFISLHISSIVPKTWGKWFPIVREKYEKTEYSKVKCFLHISGESEIHTIPNTWEKWISIARENFGKTQIFQKYGLLTYFAWNRNPYSSRNIGKVNSDRIVRETYGKTQTLQSYGFLTYFMWGINTYNYQNTRKMNSHSKEKIWEDIKILKLRVS